VLFFLAPVVAYVLARRVCLELRRRPDRHPLREVDAEVVQRSADGSFAAQERV
jgi:hypothetical protein